jgi:hypothetical protein
MTEIAEAPAEETERVTMIWPKVTKEKVRQLAGTRGLTQFTLEAVTEKIDKHYGVTMQEVSDEDREVLAVESPASHAERLSEMPLDLPHDRFAKEPQSEEERQRVIANLKGMGLTPASEITPPARPESCQKCGGELIDGECWNCS